MTSHPEALGCATGPPTARPGTEPPGRAAPTRGEKPRYSDDTRAYRVWWQNQGVCPHCGENCRRGGMCRECFGKIRAEAAAQRHVIEARFWARTRVPLSASSCWEWTGALTRGYGHMRVAGHQRRAHRVAWELVNGPIPDDLAIDHLCRNRACVNPLHMEIVEHGENVLRGMAPAAIYARQSHCKRGHLLEGDNVRWGGPKGTYRICRACARILARRYRGAAC